MAPTTLHLLHNKTVEIRDPDEGHDEDGNAAWQTVLPSGASLSMPHDADLQQVYDAFYEGIHAAEPSSFAGEQGELAYEITQLYHAYVRRKAEERATWRLTIEVNRDRRRELTEDVLKPLRDRGFTIFISTR